MLRVQGLTGIQQGMCILYWTSLYVDVSPYWHVAASSLANISGLSPKSQAYAPYQPPSPERSALPLPRPLPMRPDLLLPYLTTHTHTDPIHPLIPPPYLPPPSPLCRSLWC